MIRLSDLTRFGQNLVLVGLGATYTALVTIGYVLSLYMYGGEGVLLSVCTVAAVAIGTRG